MLSSVNGPRELCCEPRTKALKMQFHKRQSEQTHTLRMNCAAAGWNCRWGKVQFKMFRIDQSKRVWLRVSRLPYYDFCFLTWQRRDVQLFNIRLSTKHFVYNKQLYFQKISFLWRHSERLLDKVHYDSGCIFRLYIYSFRSSSSVVFLHYRPRSTPGYLSHCRVSKSITYSLFFSKAGVRILSRLRSGITFTLLFFFYTTSVWYGNFNT